MYANLVDCASYASIPYTFMRVSTCMSITDSQVFLLDNFITQSPVFPTISIFIVVKSLNMSATWSQALLLLPLFFLWIDAIYIERIEESLQSVAKRLDDRVYDSKWKPLPVKELLKSMLID